jgi:hypothetical protein
MVDPTSSSSDNADFVAVLMQLILQSLFDSLNTCGLPGDRLKQEMFRHLNKLQQEALERGESGEMYALAMGAIAVDPETEKLFKQLLKKELGKN